jgi:hypothetical protein
MNHWWLNLYTIPLLKKYMMPLLVWLIANVLVVIFLPNLREITYFAALYPWIVFLHSYQTCAFALNIDFHKVHMPYQSLRKAILLDFSAQLIVFLAIFYACGYFPWIAQGKNAEIKLFEYFGTPAMMGMLVITFILIMATNKLGIVKYWERRKIKPKKITQTILELVLVTLLAFLSYYYYFPRSYYLVFYSFVTIMALNFISLWYCEVFNVSAAIARIFRFAGLPLSLVGLVAIVWGVSFQANREVLNGNYSAAQRVSTYLMFEDFDLTLDIQTTAEILTHHYDLDVRTIAHLFKTADPQIFEMEVDQLIRQADYGTYYAYLKSGRVSDYNLTQLYQKAVGDRSKWRSSHFYNDFRKTLAHYLPEAQSLPERNIASKDEKELQ